MTNVQKVFAQDSHVTLLHSPQDTKHRLEVNCGQVGQPMVQLCDFMAQLWDGGRNRRVSHVSAFFVSES